MAETLATGTRPADPVGRVLHFCSFALVVAGGVIMSALTLMTVVSVLGRYLFNKPIQGDYELVTMGTAITVFLFLPYCHLRRGNVVVDLFLAWAPRRVQTVFDALSGLLLAAIAGAIAWRMVDGAFDMHEYSEVSYILALPVWPVFPFAIAALGLLSLSCIYTAFNDFREALR